MYDEFEHSRSLTWIKSFKTSSAVKISAFNLASLDRGKPNALSSEGKQ